MNNELTARYEGHMKTVILILGSPNDAQGNLLSIALERCRQAIIEYKKRPHAKLLCTGGFGKHFNSTDIPHGQYTQQYLIESNIPQNNFLPIALSRFTLEDAQLSLPILERHGIDHIVLITSDFHMSRAKFVFSQLMPNMSFDFAPAMTNKPQRELAKLYDHEKNALKREQENLSRE